MKKIVPILAAAGILVLAGCQKDTGMPSTSSSTPNVSDTNAVAQPSENAPAAGITATNVPATTNTP
jgi:hypothetical protein